MIVGETHRAQGLGISALILILAAFPVTVFLFVLSDNWTRADSAIEVAASPRRVDFDALSRGFIDPVGQARARVEYAIPRGGWDIEALVKDLQHMKDAAGNPLPGQ